MWLENHAEHLPDLTDLSSLVDVLSLCNFCILANVLDYHTYQFPLSKGRKPNAGELRLRAEYDYNALTPPKRRYFVYVRGLALSFLGWLACNYDATPTGQREVSHEPRSIMTDVVAPYVVQQTHALLNYKRKAEDQDLLGIENCKASDVQQQLEHLFEGNDNIPNMMDFDDDLDEYDCFAFTDFTWHITKKAIPLPYQSMSLASD
jgi:hypothetical protein